MRKATICDHMNETEPRLASEMQSGFYNADALQAAGDTQNGADRTGNELLDWVASKDLRRQRIQAAMAQLAAEAAAPPDDEPTPPTSRGTGAKERMKAKPPQRRAAARSARLSRRGDASLYADRSRYRPRKQIVEPVFGYIKSARRFDHFSMRGEKLLVSSGQSHARPTTCRSGRAASASGLRKKRSRGAATTCTRDTVPYGDGLVAAQRDDLAATGALTRRV